MLARVPINKGLSIKIQPFHNGFYTNGTHRNSFILKGEKLEIIKTIQGKFGESLKMVPK